MNTSELLQRALAFDFLTQEEGVFLYHNATTADLMYVGNELRKIQKKDTAVLLLGK
jgi:cyclic dehypoxanthinyl futalosine synthase